MSQSPKFAEQYTTAERIRFIVLYIVSGGAITAISKLYFFPWLNEFASSAHCRTALDFDGLAVLWYGLFVGMPLSFAALVGGVIGYRGYKILRDNQTPPLHEKVFRPTRIVRGKKAKLFGYLHLLAFSPFLAISIWGIPQAASMFSRTKGQPVNCTANPSVKQDELPFASHLVR
jgi:hypothetical protein